MTMVLSIYKVPSGLWAGKFIKDGIELGGISGCQSAQEVELQASMDTGCVFDTVIHESVEAIKSMLALCKTKGWENAVQVVDLSGVLGKPWGNTCTMQVLNNADAWVEFRPAGNANNSLGNWYKMIRTELAWSGPVRLVVATK